MATTDNMKTAAHGKVEHAAGAAHAAVDRASDAARPTVEHIAAGAHEAVDRVAGAATHAAEALEAKGEQLRDAQSHLIAACREQLRERPIATIAMAVAAGFALNWLLTRR